jgi:nitroreductase
MSLLEYSQWRYASKALNRKKIPQDQIDYILKCIQLAPTSSGLQPFKVFVVKGQELKDKILPIAFDQSIVSDCSHLIIFAAWDNYTEENMNEYFEHLHSVRGFSERWENYRKRLVAMYTAKSPEENFVHTARQTYIPFSYALMAAAELKIDSTPIEGFDPDALDKLLGLREKGLRSTTMIALGYRDEEKDWNAGLEKVRRKMEDLIEELD